MGFLILVNSILCFKVWSTRSPKMMLLISCIKLIIMATVIWILKSSFAGQLEHRLWTNAKRDLIPGKSAWPNGDHQANQNHPWRPWARLMVYRINICRSKSWKSGGIARMKKRPFLYKRRKGKRRIIFRILGLLWVIWWIENIMRVIWWNKMRIIKRF